MRFLAFIVFLLFIAYALFARWYFVCEIRNLCEEEQEIVEDPRLQTLQLTEGDSTVIVSGYDQFVFDSAQVSPQLNANNMQFLDTVAHFLETNPAKNLGITAFQRYSEEGQSSGMYEYLGLARANAVRQLLEERGIDKDRITMDYGLSEDEELKEPLLFNLYIPIPDEFEKLAFTFKNMTFSDANFAFDSDIFEPGEAFLAYADSVKTYLDLNPNSSLTIIGHTDNKGKERYNLGLGERRAKSAMVFFRDSLEVKSEILIESEGEKRPVASNDTEEGQQKNRRVNFILQ
ncbi:MAG: OmpA family protein [Saprospiraceae bacterium]|jgi:outer membrane protein OmpA-like peptidoglycan-associated protein|nr:OmpA family protein [Saprospiraceae bacterium]